MSIKQQVEDAIFLADNGRHLGALTILMLAVAASSRKTFPKDKTKSIRDPKKKMGDGEAFTQFLGGRIKKILFGDFGGPDIGNSGININYKGRQLDLAYILYKYYRCELVHEAELPEDIEFSPPTDDRNLRLSNGGVSVSISANNTLSLDYGWIDLLLKAITHARCNGVLFGIHHFDFVAIDGVCEKEHCDAIVKKYGTTPGRYQILKEATRHITPVSVVGDDDDMLIKKFSALVEKNVINDGAITGLSRHELSDLSGKLLPKGVEIMREIGKVYKIVPV